MPCLDAWGVNLHTIIFQIQCKLSFFQRSLALTVIMGFIYFKIRLYGVCFMYMGIKIHSIRIVYAYLIAKRLILIMLMISLLANVPIVVNYAIGVTSSMDVWTAPLVTATL